MMQKLSGIIHDFRVEGHPIRTLRRKIYTNTLGVRPERAVYKKYLKPLILNVGCGRDHIPGAVNIDNRQLETYTKFKARPDYVIDACDDWPEEWNGSFETILASHLWEHLKDPQKFFRNAWRALKEYGHLILVVPNYEYMGKVAYYRDPTHLWRCPGDLAVFLAREAKEWEIVQMNRLGRHYKFSFDIILKKV